MTQAPVDYSDLTYSLAGVRRSNPFDRRRQMANTMLQQGMDSSPVQHPLQGASRLAQALVGGWMGGQVDRDEAAAVEKQQGALAAAMAEPDPQKRIALLSASNPELGARLSGQLAVEQAKIQQQQAGLQTGGAQIAQGYGYGAPSGGPQQQAAGGDAASRIAGIESGGKYDAVGPVANAQGHRAYGKFQVLEPNIGPWTAEVLGKAMTPQEFMANPQAQDAVFKAKFGQYVQKYGSQEAAARAWFAGEGGMNNPNAADVNGMTVARYGPKFAGAGPQVAQGGNDQTGMPPQPTTQGVQGPAIVAPPPVPELQRPMPSQQIVEKHLQIYRTGGYGLGPEAQARARAAIEADAEKEFQLTHENRKLKYQQDYDIYKDQSKRAAEQPGKTVEIEGKIRDDYTGNQQFKDYRKANTVFRSAVQAAKVDSAAADLNMVYAFATLMDPGSVVRDSETGMVIATQNASDRVKGMVAAVTGGSRLSQEARANLLNEMGTRYEAYKAAHDELGKTYRGIAERSGANPENVIVPMPPVEWERPKVKQVPQASGPTEYEYRGGKLVPRK
jgi:hypothetical protein